MYHNVAIMRQEYDALNCAGFNGPFELFEKCFLRQPQIAAKGQR